jgi:hypothetical protein
MKIRSPCVISPWSNFDISSDSRPKNKTRTRLLFRRAVVVPGLLPDIGQLAQSAASRHDKGAIRAGAKVALVNENPLGWQLKAEATTERRIFNDPSQHSQHNRFAGA